ncbi:hypothetical protein [Cupriavidus basilensis]|uniref:hypothetical protein n=1 Tax=Cupriavidus basilensis TaxID=68895 RepID=UPI00284567E2|nr:hypothetical protein [Cupriavidus basilensis]MDR3382312.1 hypothetical protein [Cupriavidus basilensis]
MAFSLAQSPTFGARTTVETTNEKGVVQKSQFLAIFTRYTVKELEELKVRWLIEGKDDPSWFARQVLVGWKELIADDGTVAEYNEENKELLLSIPPAIAALQQAFWDNAITARAKN